MERFNMSQKPEGLMIEGFPDALKVVALDGPKARRFADLSLHRYDLDFSADCLERLNRPEIQDPIMKTALWEAAIVHYMKCFGANKSRKFLLIADKVYKGEPAEWRGVYDYIASLRHKNIAHDENSVLQGQVGAVLNRPGAPYKTEKIVTFVSRAVTLDETGWNNMNLLVSKARIWVETAYDKLADNITADLETQALAELVAMPSLTFKSAKSDEVHLPRSI